MKRSLLTLLAFILLATTASAQLIKEKEALDPKYLAGAVPLENDIVTFSREIPLTPGMTPQAAYILAKHWMGRYFLEHEINQRKTVAVDSAACFFKMGLNEWLVFKQSAFVTDRAQMVYTISVQITEKTAIIKMSDIAYYYKDTEKKESSHYEAEELITDKYCLNKKKDNLIRKTGKFRIKTIDKFEEIATDFAKAIQ